MPVPFAPLTRRALNLGLAALTLCCAWPHGVQAATPKDTLVLAAAFDDVMSLDPAEAFELSAGELLGNSYDRLIRLDAHDPTRLIGDVAESWTVSADGKTFRFSLRKGLKFASGNALNAHDVAFSLQRAVLLDKAPAFILTQFGLNKQQVREQIRALDEHTLSLQTDRAYAPSFVLNGLSANVASVVDRKLLQAQEQNGDMGHAWLRTHYAGSGPLAIRDWRANELLMLDRNPHYYGEKAGLARVIYRHVKEASTQRLLLEKGDIDIARNLAPQDLAALAQHPDIRTTSTPKGTLFYIGMNQKNAHLAKPEVREALKWLVDYQAIGDTLMRNIGVVHQNFLPQGLLGASKHNPYRLDVDKARALLAKAGLAQGFKISMDVRSVQPVQGIAEALQQSARRAGIDIQIIPGDSKQTVTKYRARAHELYIGQWGADYWDPHTNADTFVRNPDNRDDAKVKPLAWRNAWVIPELTRKAEAAVLERDPSKRAALYEALQSEFRASSPFIVLFQQTEVAAYRSHVRGLALGPTADTTYLFRVHK